jgi:hypothetical protein
LSRMRDGVTDLGMTLWPPTCAQARLLDVSIVPNLGL